MFQCFYPGGPAKFWQNVAKGCNASMRRKKILAKFQSDGCKASKLESVCVKRRIQQLSAARKVLNGSAPKRTGPHF